MADRDRAAPILELALDYIGRGWNPVPVNYRAKKPNTGTGWQLRVIDAANAPHYFNGGQMNIGVMLGPSSCGLTDVDLDCEEARAIASYILPRTGAIFGRASSRAAHRLYYTDLSVNAGKAVLNFDDPTTSGRILELRIGGDSGAQTVFPGSTHKDTGEAITWEENGEPASVDGNDLARRVHELAAYSLIARYWPMPGLKARHHAALIVGGFLARTGKTVSEIKIAAEAIARAANDNEWRNRLEAAQDAAAAYHAGKHAYGFAGMRKQFGREIADQIAEWLGYESFGEPASNAKPAERLIQSSAEFIATFECPDPLIEGIIMRKFIYALTGHVSKGKTAAALLFAAHIGLGKMLGSLEVEQGRVLYLAGENYVDIQMRWIAMAQQMDFDPATIQVHFRPGRFKLSEKMDQLRREIDELGGVDLAIVDGSTAFFEGDDENSNAQAGAHAVRLRELTTLKGEPSVLVLCHPPKNAGDDNLQPRGAGAMIAEWDGNLSATKDGSVTTIHWQIKIRGPDFAPLSLLLRTVAMLDILTSYLGNAATRTEWLVEIQKRFTDRRRRLRRGWSEISIDRKITKLEKLGLITGGRGLGEHYSAVIIPQPKSLFGFAGAANDSGPSSTCKLPTNENASDCHSGFVDVLMAAKQQLSKSSAA